MTGEERAAEGGMPERDDEPGQGEGQGDLGDAGQRPPADAGSSQDGDERFDPAWLAEAERAKAYLASRAPTPYYRLSAEDRRAAWEEVRLRQRRAARRSRLLPLYLIGASFVSIVVGVYVLRAGFTRTAMVLLYASLPLAAFAVIAFAKALVEGLPGGDDGLPPPPGW